MGYTRLQTQQINLKAKRKVGIIKDGDYQDFMDQCISDLTSSGEAVGDDDAEEMCQMLWEEEGE